MATGNDFLIEGSADRYAGIGYTAEQLATAHIPVESYGQNVHGVTLMKVRDQLRQVGWEQRPQWTYLVPEKQQPSFTRNDLPAFSLAPPIAAVVPVATITAPKPVDPLQRALVNSVVAPSHLPTGPGIIDFPLAPPPDLVPGGPMKLPSFDPIPVATITTPAPTPVVAAPVVIPETPVVVITAPGETVPVVEVPVVVTETPTFEAPAVEQVPEQPKVEANGLDDLFN